MLHIQQKNSLNLDLKHRKETNMREEDIEELKLQLVKHGYYIGNSKVAESLRELADLWND